MASLLKKIYLSPLGRVISYTLNMLSIFHHPFMVYGIKNQVNSKWMKHTRLSSTTKILSKNKLDIGNGVWIGHYSILDASHGLVIRDGVQTGSHISIYTHTSHVAIRLMGEQYIFSNARKGYIGGKVIINKYAFIGDGAVIFPNVEIGKGVLVKSGSIVTKSVPDYAIVSGMPAKIVGCVFDLDLSSSEDIVDIDTYFDKKALQEHITNRDLCTKDNDG